VRRILSSGAGFRLDEGLSLPPRLYCSRSSLRLTWATGILDPFRSKGHANARISHRTQFRLRISRSTLILIHRSQRLDCRPVPIDLLRLFTRSASLRKDHKIASRDLFAFPEVDR